jgi:hypothetical protein
MTFYRDSNDIKNAINIMIIMIIILLFIVVLRLLS